MDFERQILFEYIYESDVDAHPPQNLKLKSDFWFFKYEIWNQILDSVKEDFIRIYMKVMQMPTPPQNLKLQSDFWFWRYKICNQILDFERHISLENIYESDVDAHPPQNLKLKSDFWL